jgi:transglutaminase-like putative cysteine protease
MQQIKAKTRSDRVTTFDEAVLYVSITVALATAPIVASLASGSVQIALVGAALVCAGGVVSWRLRDRGTMAVLAGAPLGLAAAAAFSLLVERELAMDESSLLLAQVEVGLMIALRMSMLPIAFSYVLVRYDYMAFSLVPALAIFGLAGGQGEAPVVGVCFALFLPSALIAMGHGMLLSGMIRAGGRTDARWRLGHWRRKHWYALVITIALIIIVAYVLFLPISYYVAEYRWQLLTRVAVVPSPLRQFGSMGAGRTRNSSVLPVGRGPIAPGHAPRLTIWGPFEPLWRGQIYDHFSGQSWLRTEAPEEGATPFPSEAIPAPMERPLRRGVLSISDEFAPRPGAKIEAHLVRVDTSMPAVFYSPGQIQILTVRGFKRHGPLRIDAYGCVEAPGGSWVDGSYYQVTSSPLEVQGNPYPPAPSAALLPRTYLQIPFGSRRVADLAREVAGRESSPQRKLMALVAHLQQNYVYTLDPPAAPPNRDAADFFLFKSKRGYCDLFATSLAIMARAVGIPTRLVTGFAYGDDTSGAQVMRPRPDNPKGPAEPNFQMRESDAHVWVEAYLEPWGWVSADATPAGGESPIPPLRRSALNLRFLAQDHPSVPIAAGGLALMAMISMAFRLRGMRLHLSAFGHNLPTSGARYQVIRAYAQLLLLLRRHGRVRQPWQTPLEFLSELRAPSFGGMRQTADGQSPPARFLPFPERHSRFGLASRPKTATLDAALPAIAALTELFLLARYSSAPLTDETAASAGQHFTAIRSALRRRTRAPQKP